MWSLPERASGDLKGLPPTGDLFCKILFIIKIENMKYKSNKIAVPVTSEFMSPSGVVSCEKEKDSFISWQPTKWPKPPDSFNNDFFNTIEEIFNETIIAEIENVLNDIKNCSSEGLEHRGHVIAIALLCAIDTISSYAYGRSVIEKCSSCGRGDRVGPRYKLFIEKHFPSDYRSHANEIYKLYRNSVVHSWNLFGATMLPDNESLESNNGVLSFGLLNLFDAIKIAVKDFLDELKVDKILQKATLKRYKELKGKAR